MGLLFLVPGPRRRRAHASARRRRDADRASVAAGRPEASPGPLRQLSPEKLPGHSGSFLRGQHKSTNRSNQIHILAQSAPISTLIESKMNNETWQKPTWTRAASAEQKAWMAASATVAPAASVETWQRSWARAASVEANAWREATARPRGATAMTETWRRQAWARCASAEANAWAMAAAR